MPDAAQFTLALFDSTGLGTSVRVPADVPPRDAPDMNDADAESPPRGPRPVTNGNNYVLDGDRALARGWAARARDNIAAIHLSKEIEAAGRAPTTEEQAQLLRFVGFGANCFPLPGATGYRDGWKAIGRELADAVTPAEYAALQRATQYAHYTPESVVRALWHAAQHLGFAGGRVLEPGMGTGLFFALLPAALRGATQFTGVEYDPVTARIARLIHPEARVRCEDYTRSNLAGGFDLVIGNPPFADRIVRADPATSALGLRLHDYFVARSIERLRPGGIALFVSSTGTMDKASTVARDYVASLADLVGAVRLPEGVMHATAGTDVVVDVLVFQRRAEGQTPSGPAWTSLVAIAVEGGDAEVGEEAEGEPTVPDAQSVPEVPWLPSQIEQREGRIERQGNQHDEIEVYAYATLGSMDATMWQNNERKARFIAAALSGDRSIRTLEDAGSQANQFALAKAILSGDSRLIQKAGLAGEIARLERQRAAHFDDQLNVRRQIANARSDIAAAQNRLMGIARDLMRRTPTRGDAFAMTLEDRVISDRRVAGTLLLSKVRLAERARRVGKHFVGAIGGFELACHAHQAFPNGFEATLILKRTDYDYDLAIDPEQTPMGLIARLEHALERFEAEREEQTRREQDASARLAGDEARLGEPFPFQSELDDKLARMAQLEADLAGKSGGSANPQPFAA